LILSARPSLRPEAGAPPDRREDERSSANSSPVPVHPAGLGGGSGAGQGQKVNARWFRDFIRYDPAPAAARITVPVLAITGGHDLQVPPDDVAAIGRLVGGPFEGHVVGDVSHILRPDPASIGPRGYRRALRAPVSPAVLSLVTTWITRLWGTP
jgi:fermentation-respiration switch protein FrsA (DUF1100 family)